MRNPLKIRILEAEQNLKRLRYISSSSEMEDVKKVDQRSRKHSVGSKLPIENARIDAQEMRLMVEKDDTGVKQYSRNKSRRPRGVKSKI